MANDSSIVRIVATHLHKRHGVAAILLPPSNWPVDYPNGGSTDCSPRPQKRFRLANFISYSSGYAFCMLPAVHAAEITRPAYTPPPPAVSTSGIMQIIFSLLLVLAAIISIVWFLRRLNMAQQGSARLIKVLGGVSIGQRERIVLVEIENTWLVVGVGPGQIRTLHTLPKTEIEASDFQASEIQPAENKFPSLLVSILGRRKNGADNK